MALIKCSECGKKYSDSANCCPNCACPTDITKSKTDEETTVGDKIGNAVDNTISDLKNSFKDIKKNFKESIDKGKEEVVDKFANVVNKDENNNNDEIEIHNKNENIKNKEPFNKNIIIFIIIFGLLLIINKNTRLFVIVANLFISIISYLYILFTDIDIIKESKYKLKDFFKYLFYISLSIVLIASIVNFVNPRETIEYITIEEKINDDDKKDDTEIKKEELENKEEHIIENSVNKVKINNSSENYLGKNYKDVIKELETLGFTNIIIDAKETTDINIENDSISDFTINGKKIENGEEFNVTDEVRIIYWNKLEDKKIEDSKVEDKKIEKNVIIYPKEGSKLANDYDEEYSTSNTKSYVNVDGIRNIPKTQKYESTYVTDGVYEYINYLKELGYKVEITKHDSKNPYGNFYLYETYFKVSKGDFSWKMYLSIQNEDYVEYSFDISYE